MHTSFIFERERFTGGGKALKAALRCPETDHLLARIRDGGALAPKLWHLEVGNMLL